MRKVYVNSMEKCKTELTSVGEKLETENKMGHILRCLSPLRLVLELIPILLVLTGAKAEYKLGDTWVDFTVATNLKL